MYEYFKFQNIFLLHLIHCYLIKGIDGLVYNMLRSLTTPEINKQMPLHHLQLVQSVVEAISHNIKYFTNHQHLIRDTVTIMLTLIPHHHHHQNLLNQEINICVYFLTTKFEECSLIGTSLLNFLGRNFGVLCRKF